MEEEQREGSAYFWGIQRIFYKENNVYPGLNG